MNYQYLYALADRQSSVDHGLLFIRELPSSGTENDHVEIKHLRSPLMVCLVAITSETIMS